MKSIDITEAGQEKHTKKPSPTKSSYSTVGTVGTVLAAIALVANAVKNYDGNPTAPSVAAKDDNNTDHRAIGTQLIFEPPEKEIDFAHVTPSNENKVCVPAATTLPDVSGNPPQNPATIKQENETPPPLVTSDNKISPEYKTTSEEESGKPLPDSTVSPDDNNPKVTPENHRPASAKD